MINAALYHCIGWSGDTYNRVQKCSVQQYSVQKYSVQKYSVQKYSVQKSNLLANQCDHNSQGIILSAHK